jgi:hypothetical protein
MRPRLIELFAELDPELGIFQHLPPGFKSSSEAIKAMRDAADTNYGWPARIFAKRICERTAKGSTVVANVIAKWEKKFTKRLGPDLTGVEGQIRDKLAAVGVAGMLAKKLGVIPKDIKVIPAIDWAWKAIANQPPEANASPVEAVAAYIREHRSRFRKTPLHSKHDEADVMGLPGLIHDGEHGLEYLIPKPAFDAAFASLGGSKVVMPPLEREGFAVVENLRGRKFQMKRHVARLLTVAAVAVPASSNRRSRLRSAQDQT